MTEDSQNTNSAAQEQAENTQATADRTTREHYEVTKGNPDETALRALDKVFQSVADRAAEVQAGKKPHTRGRFGLPNAAQRGRTGAPLHPNPTAFRNS